MNKFSKTVMCMALVSVLCVAAPAAAVTISIGDDTSDVWPTAPFLETYNPLITVGHPDGVGVDYGVSVINDRIVGMSFVVTSTVSVGSMYVEIEGEAGGYTPSDFTVGLYEVADTTIGGNNDPGLGTTLAESVLTFNVLGERVHRLDFSTPITLTPAGGSGGYAIAFVPVNQDPGAGTDRDYITVSGMNSPTAIASVGGSVFHFNVGGYMGSLAFALVEEVVIPEPASLALLALGSGLMMLRRRQR